MKAVLLALPAVALVACWLTLQACTPAEQQTVDKALAAAPGCVAQVAAECAQDAGVPCSDAVKTAAVADCIKAQ